MTTHSTSSACMASVDLPAPCLPACLPSARSRRARICRAACRVYSKAQLYGIAVTPVWPGAMTFIILKVIGALVGLRVRQEDEVMGLDVSLYGEALQ